MDTNITPAERMLSQNQLQQELALRLKVLYISVGIVLKSHRCTYGSIPQCDFNYATVTMEQHNGGVQP